MRDNYDVVMVVLNDLQSDSRVLRTARSISAVGIRVLLVGQGRHSAGVEPLHGGAMEAYLVPAMPTPDKELDTPALHRAMIDHFRAQVLALCRDFTPRVVHSHDMSTIGIGAALRAHYAAIGRPVFWVHDVHEWVEGLTQISSSIRLLSLGNEDRHIRSADALTTVSPAISDALRDRYALAATPAVILSAPPLREFNKSLSPHVRGVLNLPAGAKLAVYCGQVKPPRAVHELVMALAHVPGLHVAILSNNKGSYIERLRSIAEQDGAADRLHLLPYVPEGEVPSFIRTADVGVLTLSPYGNADVALPNKLFQYLHAGLPVVVSDRPTMKRFVEKLGVGIPYEHGNIASLARALEAVLANADAYRAAATAARAEYSWEQQEEVLRAIYADALAVGTIALAPPVRWPSPEHPAAERESLRVLHGVGGSANQPWTLATALRRRGHFAHSLSIAVPRMGYRSSAYVPLTRLPVQEQLAFVEALAGQFDIFHFHARSFLYQPPDMRFPSLLDLLLLRLLGKTVIFHFRGSEVRIATQFAAANPYHYVDDDPYGFATAFPEAIQRRIVGFVCAIANGIFVTDPELLTYVPEAEIVPRAIDLTEWAPIGVPTNGERPIVVHAPTRPGIKGTEFILDAVERLRREGLDFDFVQATGMRHEEAKALYERADIIVDQLRIGWYGVLAVEGMALAKPVISYVRADLVDELPTPRPLAMADPTTITDVLRNLLQDRGKRQELGRYAREYVEKVHDADVVSGFLEARYRELMVQAPTRGADYRGIADFFLHQTQVSRKADDRLRGSAKRIARVEESLSRAAWNAERLVNAATAFDAATDFRSDAIALHEIVTAALGEVHAIASALPARPQSTVAPVRSQLSARTKTASERTTAEIQHRSRIGQAGPTSGAPPQQATSLITVGEVMKTNRWHVGDVLRELADGRADSWEEVATAAARNTEAGLRLFDALFEGDPDQERQAVLLSLAKATARAFATSDSTKSPVDHPETPPDVAFDTMKRRVRVARRSFNLRRELGRDAERLAAHLLRPAIAEGNGPDGPNPLRSATDDASRTRLNDLAWYFINTAAVSRTLDEAAMNAYQGSLAWFAERLRLWEAPPLRTTRPTLSSAVPVRVMPASDADGRAGATLQLGSRSEGPDGVRMFDRSSGRLRWIEQTVRARVDEVARWEATFRGQSEVTVDIAVPEYEFDPRRSTPRIARWHTVDTVKVHRVPTPYRLDFPVQLLAQAAPLTPFEASGGRYVSRTLNRQIEQMETLERLHPGHGFGDGAARWRGFAAYWAQQPVSG